MQKYDLSRENFEGLNHRCVIDFLEDLDEELPPLSDIDSLYDFDTRDEQEYRRWDCDIIGPNTNGESYHVYWWSSAGERVYCNHKEEEGETYVLELLFKEDEDLEWGERDKAAETLWD